MDIENSKKYQWLFKWLEFKILAKKQDFLNAKRTIVLSSTETLNSTNSHKKTPQKKQALGFNEDESKSLFYSCTTIKIVLHRFRIEYYHIGIQDHEVHECARYCNLKVVDFETPIPIKIQIFIYQECLYASFPHHKLRDTSLFAYKDNEVCLTLCT